MKKWVNVRDAFQKSCKKQKLNAKSGSGAPSTSTYIYDAQLQFLRKLCEERPTGDSLNIEHPQQSGETPLNTIEGTAEDTGDSTQNNERFKKPKSLKRKIDHVEIEMMKILKEKPDRHLSFFQAIIPSLDNFDDDEILEFQMKVLQAITEIKNRKRLCLSQHAFPPIQQGTVPYNSNLRPQLSAHPDRVYHNLRAVSPDVSPARQFYQTTGQHLSTTTSEESSN